MSGRIPNTDKYLTKEEVERLLKTIELLEDKTLILLTLKTGLRRSEVTSVQVSNIDFDRQLVKIYDDKKDEWRNLVFPSSVDSQIKMYLNSRKVKSASLFPFCDRTANRRLKKWAREAKIRVGSGGETEVTFHWLRHTFIRLSKKVGRDIKVVQQNTGDTVETILKYYRSLSLEDRIREIEDKPLF